MSADDLITGIVFGISVRIKTCAIRNDNAIMIVIVLVQLRIESCMFVLVPGTGATTNLMPVYFNVRVPAMVPRLFEQPASNAVHVACTIKLWVGRPSARVSLDLSRSPIYSTKQYHALSQLRPMQPSAEEQRKSLFSTSTLQGFDCLRNRSFQSS